MGEVSTVPREREQSTTDLVSWDLAERIAARIGVHGGTLGHQHRMALEADFAELTAEAEDLVAAETGLRSAQGPARARVADRSAWVHANVATFQRLFRPVMARFGEHLDGGPIAPRLARAATGVQVGLILGWMSTRVLGQYDLLFIEDEHPEEQDIVYYVGPNVLELERRHGFPPRQFRLWLALHEVTHRMQFTGIPWMRDHFRSLLEEGLTGFAPDPSQLLDILKRLADDLRHGRNPLATSGLIGVMASPEQLEIIHKLQALMSLLEGHGDVTMNRAGVGRVIEAERFARVLRRRRSQASGAARLLQQLIGLEAKLRQYAMGERFISRVEQVGGPELLGRVWDGPQWLPSLEEIGEPDRWVSRVSLAAPATG